MSTNTDNLLYCRYSLNMPTAATAAPPTALPARIAARAAPTLARTSRRRTSRWREEGGHGGRKPPVHLDEQAAARSPFDEVLERMKPASSWMPRAASSAFLLAQQRVAAAQALRQRPSACPAACVLDEPPTSLAVVKTLTWDIGEAAAVAVLSDYAAQRLAGAQLAQVVHRSGHAACPTGRPGAPSAKHAADAARAGDGPAARWPKNCRPGKTFIAVANENGEALRGQARLNACS